MNKEEIKIKEFDKEQLEILLNDLQDIDKFTGFKDGAFKYELGKYQASLLVNCIEKQKEVIDKIRCEFLKYNWEASNSTQICNQLSEIFKLLSIELDILNNEVE